MLVVLVKGPTAADAGNLVSPALPSVRRAVPDSKDNQVPLKLHRNSECGEVSRGEARGNFLQLSSFEALGTNGAMIIDTIGVSANSAPRTGRGGARNTSGRESFALKPSQVENLRAATLYASAIGLPFNRMITIHWESAGVPLAHAVRCTGRFIDLLSKAISRRGGRTAWVYVHEGGEKKGGHVHILAHVPPKMIERVSRLQKGWLRSITGCPYRRGVIHTRPIGGRRDLETNNPPLHQANLLAALQYMMKGVEADAAAVVDVRRVEHGGMVIGKRCGTSQNIGAKARSDPKQKGLF